MLAPTKRRRTSAVTPQAVSVCLDNALPTPRLFYFICFPLPHHHHHRHHLVILLRFLPPLFLHSSRSLLHCEKFACYHATADLNFYFSSRLDPLCAPCHFNTYMRPRFVCWFLAPLLPPLHYASATAMVTEKKK
uniref:Uncharacterized protein n=1 Tax=Trypanosoma vivax (strain Y486) TaxID=1055687 RepID=G0TSG2_TRYVY|nr:hypothetical protein TVY486_0300820 [Trypanosoma vivax Y486]